MKGPMAVSALFLVCSLPFHHALLPDSVSRRDALASSAASFAGLIASPPPSEAYDETIDLEAINAARAKSPTSLIDMVANKNRAESFDMNKISAARSKGGSNANPNGIRIVPVRDPPPIMSIRSNGKSKIPRVGYSFYKTAADQAARCTSLALYAGVRHLDVGTQYQSNAEIAKALQRYLDLGLSGLDLKEEKPDLLEQLEATRLAGEQHAIETASNPRNISPAPAGSAGRRGRRDNLFISHKISNEEQSTDPVVVRRNVKAAIQELGCQYLDMVSIHSPLTDKARRMTTYNALLDLKESGFVKAVGVCNYGLGPLQELSMANLELPAVNQIELSPFNAHKDIVTWCDNNGVAIACSAWSKLSGADGPVDQWEAVNKMAQQKGMSKAQILVRWSMQKGYICVPRSAVASKLERLAIAENSYGGVNRQDSFMLTPEEMQTLEGLDVSYKCGKLGRRDGWTDGDVTGPGWEPTDFV
jgi:diketogulonate reductase-like aldo/keto reductase